MSVLISKSFIWSKMSNLRDLDEGVDVTKYMSATEMFTHLRCGCDARREFSRTEQESGVIDSRLHGAFGQPYTIIVDKEAEIVRLEADLEKLAGIDYEQAAVTVNCLNSNLRLNGNCYLIHGVLHYTVTTSFYGVQDSKYLQALSERVIRNFEEDMGKVKPSWERQYM